MGNEKTAALIAQSDPGTVLVDNRGEEWIIMAESYDGPRLLRASEGTIHHVSQFSDAHGLHNEGPMRYCVIDLGDGYAVMDTAAAIIKGDGRFTPDCRFYLGYGDDCQRTKEKCHKRAVKEAQRLNAKAR
jgi:hypothetical protein